MRSGTGSRGSFGAGHGNRLQDDGGMSIEHAALDDTLTFTSISDVFIVPFAVVTVNPALLKETRLVVSMLGLTL